MTRILSKVASMAVVALVALTAVMAQQPAMAGDALGLGNILGGVGGSVGALTNNLMGANGVGGIMNTATNMVGGVTRPVMGVLGSLTGGQSGPLSMFGSMTGGPTGPIGMLQNPVGQSLSMTSGLLGGLTSAAQAASNIGTNNQAEAAAAGLAAARMAEQQSIASASASGAVLRNNYKREAIPSGPMAANEASSGAIAAGPGAVAAGAAASENMYGPGSGLAGGLSGGLSGGFGSGTGALMAAGAANAAASANEGIASALSYGNSDIAASGLNAASAGVQAAAVEEAASGGGVAGPASGAMMSGMAGNQNPFAFGVGGVGGGLGVGGLGGPAFGGASLAGQLAANSIGANNGLAHVANVANSAASAAGNAVAAHHVANAAHAANVANVVSNAAAAATTSETALVGVNQAANHVIGRQALAADALGNAQAEAAIAGADMAAHGANNARSASLAGNAYRQAKLASARDRVNIAGTIQNSARISDAAIATHDAATKAEDSLLGSELAVDSAATVLDSDAAYIPPVTNSLLRSLPYGRLGVRNIIPKPLTYPSVLLPDVWLNGAPVNYMNVPLRMLPYGVGSTLATNQLWQNGAALANGGLINGQPFIANNGRYLNGMVIDPAYSHLLAANNAYGAAGSSIVPILANGQVEAQDEVALANMVNIQQLNGAGMSATYQGYGRNNPVPMITGSVNDVNLMPTTTIGTTYPIGSALVIEPRDSYFQDYVDNASSRQNFDERQQ